MTSRVEKAFVDNISKFILVVGLSLIPNLAFAGEWEVVYSRGTITSTGPTGTTTSQTMPGGGYVATGSQPGGPVMSVSISGPITATFTWKRRVIYGPGYPMTDPNDNPPSQITIRDAGNVSSFGIGCTASTGFANNTVSGGQTVVNGASFGMWAEGSRLTSIDNPADSFEISSPSLNASTSSNHQYGGGYSVGLGYSASIVKVSVSRDGAEGDTDYAGAIHGHTTYSFYHTTAGHSNFPDNTSSVVNWQEFSGDWGNIAWGPLTTASWSPSYSGATSHWNKWSMPFGNQNMYNGEWKGTTGESTYALTYMVTDPNQGSATAKYIMHVHDTLEKVTEFWDDNAERNAHASGSAEVKNISYTDPLDADGASIEHAYSHGITVELGFNFDVCKWILDSIGVSVGYTYSIQHNSVQQCPGITLPPRTYTYGVIYNTYREHYGTNNRWSPNGHKNVEQFSFFMPRPPGEGIRMHAPIPLSGSGVPPPPPGNGNSGSGSPGGH